MIFLFRTCSVAPNLVMSLDFNPVRCGTMVCLFGQSRNGSAVISFIRLGSTAVSRAASDYVTVPEHFSQNEEPTKIGRERARNQPSSAPKTNLNQPWQHRMYTWGCEHEFFVLFFLTWWSLLMPDILERT